MDKAEGQDCPVPKVSCCFPAGKRSGGRWQTRRAFPAHPTKPITAWGLIGAGIRAYDYMDGVQNK